MRKESDGTYVVFTSIVLVILLYSPRIDLVSEMGKIEGHALYLFRMEAPSMRLLGKFNISPVKEKADKIYA